MKSVTKWFGDILQDEIVDALKIGVNKSTGQIFEKSQDDVPVLTGGLKASGERTEARVGKKEVYGIVRYRKKYAIFVEFNRMFLRRSMVAVENNSLFNFQDTLKLATKRKK